MVAPVDTAYVRLWGMLVGAVSWRPDRGAATFEFDRRFLDNALDVAPLTMPLADARRGDARYEFRQLPIETFSGLPGLLSDALPDRFGNQIIDAWLVRQGRTFESFNPVERLCYTGTRAMGALAFSPVIHPAMEQSAPVDVAELVELAQAIVAERSTLNQSLNDDAADAIADILRVGTSAGGARPKAVVAINDQTGEVRSGQVEAPDGFDYWILKFDGVSDRTLGDPAGYGRIEYAYHRMAVAAGIAMTECRLLEENNRAHFMTRRFDRTPANGKLHLQSLCAVAHYDFNNSRAYSYEHAFQVMRELRLPYTDAEELFRRMVFNVVARNQDDHTKNISFLMDRSGIWRLAPAYDVIYAYNPAGQWTSRHQMSINGKREGIGRSDLREIGQAMNIKRVDKIADSVVEVVSRWQDFAKDAGVEPGQAAAIGRAHQLL